MPGTKKTSYRTTPFSIETKKDDFYVYWSIADCFENCEESMEGFLKCRTIGLLLSDHGRYYLKDLQHNTRVQVSMVYQKEPPRSTLPPYPVQMFGELQWRKRPVIFAKVIQMMTPAMALRMIDTLDSVTRLHRVQVEPTKRFNITFSQFSQAEDIFNETFDDSTDSRHDTGKETSNKHNFSVKFANATNNAPKM